MFQDFSDPTACLELCQNLKVIFPLKDFIQLVFFHVQLKSQQKEELQFKVCAITVLGNQRVHSRLHLQGFGPRQVVAGDDPGVQDAAVLVDPPRGPPVPAAAGHTEQVALLEG